MALLRGHLTLTEKEDHKSRSTKRKGEAKLLLLHEKATESVMLDNLSCN